MATWAGLEGFKRKIAKLQMNVWKKLICHLSQIAKLESSQRATAKSFLARALAQESDLYLMDEPFSGVDAVTEKSIINLLRELKSSGKTVVVVHHDLSNAKEYFDELILLNMRLIAHGKTKNVFTKDLLQKTYGGRLAILSEIADESIKQNTKITK